MSRRKWRSTRRNEIQAANRGSGASPGTGVQGLVETFGQRAQEGVPQSLHPFPHPSRRKAQTSKRRAKLFRSVRNHHHSAVLKSHCYAIAERTRIAKDELGPGQQRGPPAFAQPLPDGLARDRLQLCCTGARRACKGRRPAPQQHFGRRHSPERRFSEAHAEADLRNEHERNQRGDQRTNQPNPERSPLPERRVSVFGRCRAHSHLKSYRPEGMPVTCLATPSGGGGVPKLPAAPPRRFLPCFPSATPRFTTHPARIDNRSARFTARSPRNGR